jgi:hypothetical protein
MNTVAALILIVLHSVEGHEITINTEQITSLVPSRETEGAANELFVGGVHCVVGMTNGKYHTVIEDCATIRKQLTNREGITP